MREPLEFIWAELSGRQQVRRYRLRDSGQAVLIRHPLLDMWVLEEVFRHHVYEPPPEALAALACTARPLCVADLGAHIGLFGLFVSSRLQVGELISYEPDPRNVEILRRCIEANSLADRWQVRQLAAGTTAASRTFESSFHLSRVSSPGDSTLNEFQSALGSHFSFLNGSPLLRTERHEVAQVDVLPDLARADLIKLDVEGAEWEILEDPRLAELSAAAIVLEYHPAYVEDPEPEARVSRLLRRAGYEVLEPRRGADAGTVWAWRVRS